MLIFLICCFYFIATQKSLKEFQDLFKQNFSYPETANDPPLSKENALKINDYFGEIEDFDFFIIKNKSYDNIFDYLRKIGMGNLCALIEFFNIVILTFKTIQSIFLF